MKMKTGGWKYIIISLLVGIVSAVICLTVGSPQIVANAIPVGVTAATIVSLKSKWMV
jgi:hypothetical protein